MILLQSRCAEEAPAWLGRKDAVQAAAAVVYPADDKTVCQKVARSMAGPMGWWAMRTIQPGGLVPAMSRAGTDACEPPMRMAR